MFAFVFMLYSTVDNSYCLLPPSLPGWQFGVVVVSFVASMKLLYVTVLYVEPS